MTVRVDGRTSTARVPAGERPGHLRGGVTTTVTAYTVDELSAQLTDAGARYLVTLSSSLERALEAKQRIGLREVFVFDQALKPKPALVVHAEVSEAEALRLGLWSWLRRCSRAVATLGSEVKSGSTPTTSCDALLTGEGLAPRVAIDARPRTWWRCRTPAERRGWPRA
ncbi:MAG TPA: hypothetical protein VGP82_23730 [Ktedonobacterales bacterium]|nr:hypothetical protein [Ktedonobacterales bacterium]